jgi:hypothetical protein
MRVTCICVCHDKPDVAHEAIGSVLRQSYRDWEAIIVDSGVLFDQGYYEKFAWRGDPRIRLIRSKETDETRRTKAMAPWCFNECIRGGWVTGDLVIYLCDDDLLYPNAFESFVRYSRAHSNAQAMYASQDMGVVYPNGWHTIVGERRADGMGGRSCNGRRMDCEIDYLQFCHRTSVLQRFPSDEYWPEEKDTEEHADGIFMERIGALVPIHPIDVKVSQNRRTPRSLNIPMSPLSLMDCMANGIPLVTGEPNRVSTRAIEANDDPIVTIALRRGDLGTFTTQSYARLEVIEIDDNASDSWRGALSQARGEYFLPLSSGQRLMPDTVERLLAKIQANTRLSAVTCYLLGVEQGRNVDECAAPARASAPPLMALRSPEQMLASVKNVVGSALFRTKDLRAVGGFDSGADAASGDWSAFFKLVNAGRQVDILPEHLFWSANKSADSVRNAELLKPFVAMDRVLAAEREALWKAMAGYERRLEELARENRHLQARLALLRYRIADFVHSLLLKIPIVVRGLKWLFGYPACAAGSRSPQRKQGRDQPVAKNASAAA